MTQTVTISMTFTPDYSGGDEQTQIMRDAIREAGRVLVTTAMLLAMKRKPVLDMTHTNDAEGCVDISLHEQTNTGDTL